MRIFKKVALALVGTALTGAAHATPITYTLSGHVSGSLFIGVVTENFSDVPLLWTVGSNTNTSSIVDTHGGPTIEMTALSDRIDLGGTVLVPSIPTVFAAASVPVFPGNPVAFGIGGFVDTTALMGLAWHAPGAVRLFRNHQHRTARSRLRQYRPVAGRRADTVDHRRKRTGLPGGP